QYGSSVPLPAQTEPSIVAREAFRRSMSCHLADKTASSIIDVLAAMSLRRVDGGNTTDWSDLTTPLVHVNAKGEIQVYVTISEVRPEAVTQLEALGLRVEISSGSTIQGWVDADAIDSLATLDFVRQIRPPGYGLRNQSGSMDTAGN